MMIDFVLAHGWVVLYHEAKVPWWDLFSWVSAWLIVEFDFKTKIKKVLIEWRSTKALYRLSLDLLRFFSSDIPSFLSMKNVSDIIKYIVFVSIIIFEFYGLASGTARAFLGVVVGVLVIYLIKTLKFLDYPVVRELFLLLILNVIYYYISPKAVAFQFTIPRETTGFFANIVLCLGVFFISYYYMFKILFLKFC